MTPRPISAFVVLASLLSAAAAQTTNPPRFTPEVSEFVKNFKPGGQDFAGQISVLPPEESIRKMVLPDGYVAELVASEPAIAPSIASEDR